ncbi:MAG TPA: pantetheine-phosphate adenylyltransferase [Bacteroidia bacterium]|jgi:pantetheine-phosphate adenylyltransferase|nr:pantetheine-phosphate adenylyltransferase [Bacteroidia bacterium]
MARIAVFPGSFDPVTKGHESIVLRALPLFDIIIVAIGNNSTKTYMFPLEKRKEWLKQTFAAHKQVQVEEYSGLTVDFCRSKRANYILRGIRTPGDYEFESNIAQMNKMMQHDLESIFMLTLPEHTAISSTIVRDILKHGGDAKQFIPSGIVLK